MMTAEQLKQLDRLLIEDGKLVKELIALGGGAEKGEDHLLAYEAGRIQHLKSSIAAQRAEARQKRYWAQMEEIDRKMSARNAPKVYPGRDPAMPYVGPGGSLTG